MESPLLSPYQGPYEFRREGLTLTGYVVPGFMEDGAWML